MADPRTVSVTTKLIADQYFANLRKMRDETAKTSQSAEASFRKQTAAMDTLGRGAVAVSLAFTGAFVGMVKASADFESRMSQVQAVSKATGRQMEQLRSAAFTAGKAFGLSATQVADAQIELAKAGVSTKDIIGGALPGALALAAAGQLDVAKATEIASNAMTIFSLNGKDLPHVADLLAASADKSVASVESVGDALNQSGLVANQFGLSVEDTVGTLTAFSKNALNGSDAGTSFKTMLIALANPSKQARNALAEYNISAYDARGNFVGITNLAGQLQDGFKGVAKEQRDAALATIFGNDGLRAANVLYKTGAENLQGFIDANNEAGFATLQASKKLDNLNGDVQKLGAAIQNDLIGAGSAGQDTLRGIAKDATGLLTVFGDLPKPIQGTALAVAGVGAAVTGAAAGFLILTPRVAAAKTAMADLNITGRGMLRTFGRGAALSIGLAAVTSGFAALGQTGETTAAQLNLAAKSTKNGFGNLDKLFKGDAFNGIDGVGDALKQSFSGNFAENTGATAKFIDGITFGLSHLSDVYKSNEGQFKAIGEQLGSIANTDYDAGTASFNRFVEKVGGGTEAVKQALQAFPAYREALVALLNSSGKAATEQNILAAATGRGGVATAIRDAQTAAAANAQTLNTLAGSAADAKVDISGLAKTIAGFGGATLDARSAQRAFEQAVDDAAQAVKDNGRTLDISTQAGRDNQAALDGIASAATAAASKVLEQTGSQDKAAAAIKRGRKAFIDAAEQMGVSRDKAKDLADQLNLIPSNVATAVGVNGLDAAKTKVDAFNSYLDSLTGSPKQFLLGASVNYSYLSGGTPAKKASGGPITGGTPGRDSVPILAMPGEHVLTTRDVKALGGQTGVYALRAGLHTLPGYAAGGAIGDSKTARDTAARQVKALTTQLSAAKKTASAADKAVDRLSEKDADKAAKKAAQARAEAAAKAVDALEKRLDAAKQRRDTATSQVASLRTQREDFVSTERRGVTDPLSYVDQLRSMSRDDSFSARRRDRFQDAANRYEKSLVTLAAKAQTAADELSKWQDASKEMRDGIAQAISGGYQLTGAANVQSTGTSFTRDGIMFQSTTSGTSADSIDSYYRQGAGDATQFAADLKTLAARGLNGKLLAELAGYGVAQGAPIAKALLSGTGGQLASINANYQTIQGAAAAAGTTVADYNYSALIQDAQRNADKIADKIEAESGKLRKLIASAFGLTGYAIGTMAATPGWHLVGEKGPELLNFAGGEQVLNAQRTRSMIAAASGRQQFSVSGPSTVTVVDADGTLIGSFRTAARQEAQGVVAAKATMDGIYGLGGAA